MTYVDSSRTLMCLCNTMLDLACHVRLLTLFKVDSHRNHYSTRVHDVKGIERAD